MMIKALDVEQLSVKICESELPFSSIEELQSRNEFLGQQRAKEALSFGMETDRLGYNLFVMGDSGSGRISMLMRHLETRSQLKNAPPDYVYVNNFEEVREPWVIEMPTGLGKKLVNDCEKMISQILTTVPAALENPGYQRKKAAIDKEFNQRVELTIQQVEKKAIKQGVALYQESSSISFSPVIEGQVVDDIQFASLPEDERDKLNQTIDDLEEELNEALLEMPQWKRESYEALQSFNSITIDHAIEPSISELEQKYLGLIGVQIYIKNIRNYFVKFLLENFELIESSESKSKYKLRKILQHTFIPNLLITNNPQQGAPVVYEAHPTYTNLFGRIEYWNDGGANTTSFQHIRGGALHRANGGYLVVEIEKILEDPYIWGQIKQALKTQELKFEPPMVDAQSNVAMGLNPHGVPLNLKIILVGSRKYYYFLQQQEPEFRELFRVLVDFDEQLDRTEETIIHLGELVKSTSISEGFATITKAGFIELIKFSARICGHQEKLTARFGEVFELLGEADIIRKQQGMEKINDSHIVEAQNLREFRHSRTRNKMIEEVLEDRIIINTSGSTIGSINALTVWTIGTTNFGTPARITATVFPGKKGIVDIEKESELGLSIHSKGVLILSGYLANRYAKNFPLTLSANIVMEQSYGLVDGDSASLAELCALISAITEFPINESFAVTGSINQFGEVQAIGGVNEKIEGFYLLCKARGLTGQQGVIIPQANLSNLMLKKDVIEAVENNLFNIYTVENVEQALELLCLPKEITMFEFERKITEHLKILSELGRSKNDSDHRKSK